MCAGVSLQSAEGVRMEMKMRIQKGMACVLEDGRELSYCSKNGVILLWVKK